MKRKRADRFIKIYNCSADSRPAPEVIAIDSVRHVWMALPNEREVVIEYYRQSTDSIASMKEYYNCKSNAQARMALHNVELVLRAAGTSREPARVVVPTRNLHHGVLVEIEATAEMPE